MHDSLQLAQQIIKHGLDDLEGAVAEYEKEMFPRALEHFEDSIQAAEGMFAPDAPLGFLKAMGE